MPNYFIEKYNVGFVRFGDENFGSDKKWLNEFLIAIKPRDLIWTVSGMRARTVSNDLLRNMSEVEFHFAIEGINGKGKNFLLSTFKEAKMFMNADAIDSTKTTWLDLHKITKDL